MTKKRIVHKRGVGTLDALFDAECLDRIQKLLDGTRWDIDTFDQVAELVRITGREVRNVEEAEDDA